MTAPDAAPPGRLDARIRDITLIALGGLSGMSPTFVAPALPEMSARFAATPDVELLVRLVVALPTVLLAVSAPLIGWAADRLGRKSLLVAATLLYAAIGMLPAVLDDLGTILASRAAFGLVLGVMYTLAPAMFGDFYAGTARYRAMALLSAGTAGGGAVLTIAGGALAEFGWRAPFAMHAVALLLLPPLLRYVHDAPRVPAGPPGTDDAAGRWHLVPLPALLVIYIVICFGSVIWMQLPLNVPFVLEERGIGGPWLAGVILAWAMAMMALVGPFFPRLRRHATNPTIYAGVIVGLGAGLALMAVADTLVLALIAVTVFGAAMSQMFANSSTWVMAATASRVRGRVIGTLVLAIYMGQFLAPLMLLPILRATNLTTAMLVIAAGAAAVGMLVLAGARHGLRP